MLIDKLLVFDDLYYNTGKSSISDNEYDKLRDDAKKENPDHPYFMTIGSSVSGEKIKLPFVLGSLNKVKPNTIEKWLSEHKGGIIASEKLDGVSFAVNYLKGKPIWAATRGDGEYGKNITDKAKIFCPEITYKGFVSVRGECMLIGDTYKKLGLKNARNGCAGIINRDGIRNVEHITPIFYEVIDNNNSEYARMQFLDIYFPAVADWHYITEANRNIKLNAELISNLLKDFKSYNNYNVDGVVLTLEDYVRENVLLHKNKIAYKENEEGVEAIVRKVEWNVSRTSRITPVIIIEPVEIQGVTINRATGFNYEFINVNDIGKGTKISLMRSGDVIPYVSSVIEGTKQDIPKSCPSCGGLLQVKGVDLVCNNKNCFDMAYKQVEHFLTNLGAERITTKTLRKLSVNTIEKLYELDEFGIAGIEGFGIKRGQQIIDEIQKTLNTTPDKLIRSFGISGIGRTASKAIYDHFRPDCKNDEHFMQLAFHFSPAQLQEIDGIGEVIATNYFKNIRYFESLYDYLKNQGLKFKGGKKMFEGMLFTLTGKDPLGIGRKEIQGMIENQGGVVRGISKSVNYLVIGDPNSQSGKAKKARQYGISIISYKELMEMMKG